MLPRTAFLWLVGILALLLACQQFDAPTPTATEIRVTDPGQTVASEKATIPSIEATAPVGTTAAKAPGAPTVPVRTTVAAPTLWSPNRAAEFGLEEFPHFPVDAIVRISTPMGMGSWVYIPHERGHGVRHHECPRGC